MCAVHGKPFCSSARNAFSLLVRNVLRAIAIDQVTNFLFFIMRVFVTVGMGTAAYFYFISNNPDELQEKSEYVYVPVAVISFGTWLICGLFLDIYSMAVDTLFLCFCKLKKVLFLFLIRNYFWRKIEIKCFNWI